MARILGVDLGDVRTGVAVSDPDEKMAFGITTLTEYSEERLITRIADYAKERNVSLVIFGLPINMDGSKGFRAEKIENFAAKFKEATGYQIGFCDERCSTMLAHTFLNESSVGGKKRKKVVDTLSAEIILQSYLDKEAAKKRAADQT